MFSCCFHALYAYTSALVIYCIISSLFAKPEDKQRRQPAVRYYSKWYTIRLGVGELARGNSSALNSGVSVFFTRG